MEVALDADDEAELDRDGPRALNEADPAKLVQHLRFAALVGEDRIDVDWEFLPRVLSALLVDAHVERVTAQHLALVEGLGDFFRLHLVARLIDDLALAALHLVRKVRIDKVPEPRRALTK